MSSHSLTRAVSDRPVAEDVAEQMLITGASALSATLAGFFAAAGASADVLLSPLTLIFAGLGEGARAFDGRARQPGLGAKRPRGLRPEDSIPPPARAAVPTGIAALLVAHAYDPSTSLRRLVQSGLSRAREVGAIERAAYLERLSCVGAAALAEARYVRPMLAVAGPSEGGLMTPSDFSQTPILDYAAYHDVVGPTEARLRPPWHGAEIEPKPDTWSICTMDRKGIFVALTVECAAQRLCIQQLELEVPLVAKPVMRGVSRITPGEFIPTPTPAWIEVNSSALPQAVCIARSDGSQAYLSRSSRAQQPDKLTES